MRSRENKMTSVFVKLGSILKFPRHLETSKYHSTDLDTYYADPKNTKRMSLDVDSQKRIGFHSDLFAQSFSSITYEQYITSMLSTQEAQDKISETSMISDDESLIDNSVSTTRSNYELEFLYQQPLNAGSFNKEYELKDLRSQIYQEMMIT